MHPRRRHSAPKGCQAVSSRYYNALHGHGQTQTRSAGGDYPDFIADNLRAAQSALIDADADPDEIDREIEWLRQNSREAFEASLAASRPELIAQLTEMCRRDETPGPE